jgi:hypothetical protein
MAAALLKVFIAPEALSLGEGDREDMRSPAR